jgi:hypothetical protein
MSRQNRGSQHSDAAFAFDIAHRNRRFVADSRRLDETKQVIQPIEADDVIYLGHARDLRRAHLSIAPGNDNLSCGVRAFSPAHQLARFPIGTVRHRASVDDIAVGRVFERHERVPYSQTGLYHGGIVLVDLATECGDGNLHTK